MNPRPHFIIDTSTLIGAILRPHSVPRQALLLAVTKGVLCVSLATQEELREVLHRPKFDRYTSLRQRLEFLELTIAHSSLCHVDDLCGDAARNACRDTKDAKFLALALQCQATALVSSDADLLVLNPWNGIPIVSPSDFLLQF